MAQEDDVIDQIVDLRAGLMNREHHRHASPCQLVQSVPRRPPESWTAPIDFDDKLEQHCCSLARLIEFQRERNDNYLS